MLLLFLFWSIIFIENISITEEGNIVGQEDDVKTTEVNLDENEPTCEEQEETKKKRKGSRGPRPFPQNSLREALDVSIAIRDHNAGNPWDSEQLAKSLNSSAKSKKMFYLTASSRDYGLTTGTSSGKIIELTSLGRKIVFPTGSQQEHQALQQAFFNIDIFKSVFEYYQNGKLPEKQYLFNTLQETFNLPQTYHEEFFNVYTDNISYLNEKGIEVSGESSISHNSSTEIVSNTKLSTIKTFNGKELFVIMPFSEKTDKFPNGFFDEVFNSLIVPASANAGFVAQTAQKNGSDIIHKTIVNSIFNAEIILADLTEHNPNVLFELGLAIAFKKKVAIIRAKGTNAIFDVDNSMRVLDYNPNLWKSTVEMDIEKLTNHLKSTLESDDSMYLDIFLDQ